MNFRLWGSVLAMQWFLASKAFPSGLFPVPDRFSVGAGILVFMFFFWIAHNEQGWRAWLLGGLSLLCTFLPATTYFFSIRLPFQQSIYFFLAIAAFLFFTGALIMFTLVAAARHLRGVSVLLMPLLFESFQFLIVVFSTHSGLIPPPTVSPGSTLTAFPPLMQLASFTGVFGADFLVLFLASLLAVAAQEIVLLQPGLRRRLGLKPELQPLTPHAQRMARNLALAVLLGLGTLVLAGNLEAAKIENAQSNRSRSLAVALVQPNLDIPRGLSDPKARETLALENYREAIRAAARQHADLVVFPENIWPESLPRAEHFWEGLRSALRESKIFAIAGMMTQTDGEHLHNRWYLLDREGEIRGTYAKRYLIPFGEYIPYRTFLGALREAFNGLRGRPREHPELSPVTKPNMDVTPGTRESLFVQDQSRYFIKICDELQFSRYFREGVRLGGEAVFSPSTGEWFPTPLYFRQFLAQACFRAVETRRWIGRTANYANAYFVNAQGRLECSTPFNSPAVLVYDVPLLTYQTFYVRFGNLFGWSCVLLSLGAFTRIAVQKFFEPEKKTPPSAPGGAL